MKKFEFTDQTNTRIRHNLAPNMIIQIIFNDTEEYDQMNDCFEWFEFLGNKIVVKWVASEEEMNAVEDYSHLRSILRRAWNWYKSQVRIEKYVAPDGPMEDERYHLVPSEDGKGWCCTDKDNLYLIVWKHKDFNEGQEVKLLEDFDKANVLKIAKWGREMGEWLSKNHKSKI